MYNNIIYININKKTDNFSNKPKFKKKLQFSLKHCNCSSKSSRNLKWSSKYIKCSFLVEIVQFRVYQNAFSKFKNFWKCREIPENPTERKVFILSLAYLARKFKMNNFILIATFSFPRHGKVKFKARLVDSRQI